MFTWILIHGFGFVLECLVLLTWNAIAAFSEECVAKLVHGVLLLYLVVSSDTRRLAIGSCKSEKRAARLY